MGHGTNAHRLKKEKKDFDLENLLFTFAGERLFLDEIIMIRADFSKSTNLFLAYPKGFSYEYESLVPFYDQLIELIPRDINLFVITNTKKAAREVRVKFNHKPNVDTIVINYFDEIWLRDCMGVFAGDKIFKFNYSPNYCTLGKEINTTNI
jgi:agmatine/peptidylarginine deiminase